MPIGVLEGSVLSPCLFGILFSVIWDIFDTSNFPTPDIKIYNNDSLWLIAYADDLVVITLSWEKLQTVLNKMFHELKKMNLQMRCFPSLCTVLLHALNCDFLVCNCDFLVTFSFARFGSLVVWKILYSIKDMSPGYSPFIHNHCSSVLYS